MKYYVVSDIHGFYDEFIDALVESGYDPENNDDQTLIVLGDCFDRGDYPYEVMRFLEEQPRCILIRGNHEDLLEECCEREYPTSYDKTNGTLGTIYSLGNGKNYRDFERCCQTTWALTRDFLNKMVNFYETKKYIFVHSWIPKGEDWRYAHNYKWDKARWGNPFKCDNQTDKTIVFGHWHTSYGHSKIDHEGSEFGDDANFSIYYGYDRIGIDACTAHSHKVNILVLEDEPIE